MSDEVSMELRKEFFVFVIIKDIKLELVICDLIENFINVVKK